MKKKEFITGAAGTLALTVTRAAVMLLVMMLTATTATAAVINVASTANLGTKTAGSDATYSGYYLLADGNTYRLTADVNLDGYLRVENATVTIDLNGHKLNRGLTESTKLYNGGVININGGTLTICDSGSGGTITGGYSKDGAGGLYVNMNSTVTMTSGTISGNYADKTAGGVYIHYTSTFNMTGGTVTNNTSGSNGKCGGVYIMHSSKQNKYGTFNVSGSARVTANKLGSTTSNVYLPSGGTFNVTGALTGNASVGVTMEDGTGTFAQGGGSPAYSITESDLTHFKSDISSHYVWYQPDSDGKAYLTDDDPTLYYKLTWNATGGYFEIRDEQDLIDLGDFTASNAANTCEGLTFKLTADLDFTNMPTRRKVNGNNGNFHPIGLVEDASFDGIFSGHFDGQNHTIKGLRYTNKIASGSNYNDITGLFKTVDGSSAVVERVILIDPQISGTDKGCGGIAGLIRNGATIRNCTVLGGTITRTGNGKSGGIVGSNASYTATIEGCTVIGTSVQDGMIIGYGNSQQTIKDCIYYDPNGIGIAENTYTDGGDNQRVYQLTLGDDVTTSTAATYSSALLPGKAYYTSGATVTLSNSATAAPQGYQYAYTASAGTLSGTTLTMPDQDVTITAALISTHQPVTVAYIKADGTPGEANAIALDGTETSLAAGTYFAGLENVNFDHTLNLTGDVTLILCDGCEMNVGTSGSRIDGKGFGNTNYNIDIYAQSLGTGALTIYNSSTYSGRAPIAASALTINGGIITADASGTNAIYAIKDVTINRGTVTANGHDYGIYISSGDIIISGGTVNATAGTSNSGINARAGNVTINGGNVTATGGTYGIRAGSGNITLGWNKPTDRISITASSYYGTVKVADGKKLHNGSDYLGGTLSDPAADVNGKTLRPAATATYTTADGTTDTADAILLDASDNSLPAGNYLATGTLNYTHGITLAGNVTLILADNCHMNVGTSGSRISDYGIDGHDNLEIYGQANGTGALSVYVAGELSHAINEGTVTIYGGNITADADGNSSAAIYAEYGLTVNRGTVSATATGNDCSGIYSIAGSVAINGGTVTAGGAYFGIYAETDVNISGGTVSANAPNGIEAGNGTITLTWADAATDRITASSYSGTVTLARLFTDAADPADNYYGGTYTGDALNALAGKTLSGTTEVTLTEDNVTQALAAINGMSGIGVTFNRAFTASKPSTICLPFDYTKKEGDGSFYAFTSIEHSGSEYIATMTEPGTETLTANTPYLYLPSATGNVEFSGTPTTAIAAGTTTSDDWTFQGTYDEVKWDTAPTGIYGFSAQDVSDQSISQGEFVKVGAKVRIRPLRAYLKYKNGTENYSAARTRGTTADLPDRIIVRLIGSDGNTTAIGTLDTRTGEVEIDTWYDLNGRKLSAKPTHRGIYINNGRKVVIK